MNKKTGLVHKRIEVSNRLKSDIFELATKKNLDPQYFLSLCVVEFLDFANSWKFYPKVDYDFAHRLLPKYEIVRDWASSHITIGITADDRDRIDLIGNIKKLSAKNIIVKALIYMLALEYSKNVK